MNGFDHSILSWLNQLAQRSPGFDSAVGMLSGATFLKGGLLMSVLLWFWFGKGEEQRRHRQVIVATAVACVLTIAVGRLLAFALPYRVRPLYNPELQFVVPYGFSASLRGWSSFPSDHAMIFATMATGLWFIRPAVGVVAHVYAVLLIAAPRVYLGLHHPTDVIAGMLLGIAFGVAFNVEPVRVALARRPLGWVERFPSAFYALGFLATIELATMFNEMRALATSLLAATHSAWCELRPQAGAHGCRPPVAPPLARRPLQPCELGEDVLARDRAERN